MKVTIKVNVNGSIMELTGELIEMKCEPNRADVVIVNNDRPELEQKPTSARIYREWLAKNDSIIPAGAQCGQEVEEPEPTVTFGAPAKITHADDIGGRGMDE